MSEEERGRRLRELKAKVDSLPDKITDTRIIAELAREYRRLQRPINEEGGRFNG